MAFTAGEASSSSSTPRSWTYHVFLSFSGDTRKGFTDHLYASLQRKGITTFKDDKDLERGEEISQELMKAIEESMFAITVLSPNYAFSTWCLDELQKMIECNKNQGLVVVPVFYGVDPSDVRHQRGSFVEAFIKHEKRFGQDTEKVKRWKEVLRQVASYSGWDAKNQYEAALVEMIVEHIYKKLIPKLPSCTQNLVGIASRVEKVYSLIGMGLNDIRFIGIWGMGGIGKTTIARAVYEAIQCEFKASCFLANVREVSEINSLVHIQRELVSHLCITRSDFSNLYDGKNAIRNSLCRKKVLIVLDDVSEVSQLENLAGNKDWFGPGSRVIITTRDMHLLRIHEVHETYEVGSLVQNEALHLFCLKAFKRDQPQEKYLDLSKQVIEYAKGLPLALEVLGSYLYGRTVDVWHSALKQITSNPHSKIQEALKLSYDGLHPTEKNLFLDIACFFKGMPRDKVIDILEKCGQFPKFGIEVLIERSLVTLNWCSEKLDMHDLLQEMGRNIVFQESPNDPGRRSRLWSQEDIDHVLTKNEGTEAIQGIVLNLLQPYEARWSTKAFSKTSQLKFLSLSGMQLPCGLSCLPSSLKVLHWRGCPLKILPLTTQPYDVVEIQLSHSKIEQLWHGKKFLEKLKVMDLSFSKNLKQSPDLSVVPNLEAFVLIGCTSLTKIHPSLVHHKKLVQINLTGCKSLKALPSKLEMSSLKDLILTGCSVFQVLPEFGGSMKHLSMLSLQGTAISKLPTSLGNLVGLSSLNLVNCKNLVSLPGTIGGLKSLRTLNISNCSKLCRLPEGLKEMKCLEILCASDTALEINESSSAGSTPIGLRLPPFVSSLRFLQIMDLSYCNLSEESFPHDFCHLSSLRYLDLCGNNFVSLPWCISKLSKLEYLQLNWCQRLQSLPQLPSSIRGLEASNCDSLETSKFNPLMTCNVFTSPYCAEEFCHGCVRFQMLITGCEIPSWFVCQEVGDYVSIPPNCPLNEMVGITLCFLLVSDNDQSEKCFNRVTCSMASCIGNRHITDRYLPPMKRGCPHLYIVCLAKDHFSDEIHGDIGFQLFPFERGVIGHRKTEMPRALESYLKIVRSGARLVRKQDIEDLNKNIEQMQ